MRFIPPPNSSSSFEVSAIFWDCNFDDIHATLRIYGIASINFINTSMLPTARGLLAAFIFWARRPGRLFIWLAVISWGSGSVGLWVSLQTSYVQGLRGWGGAGIRQLGCSVHIGRLDRPADCQAAAMLHSGLCLCDNYDGGNVRLSSTTMFQYFKLEDFKKKFIL